jgi:hypothetical protein
MALGVSACTSVSHPKAQMTGVIRSVGSSVSTSPLLDDLGKTGLGLGEALNRVRGGEGGQGHA